MTPILNILPMALIVMTGALKTLPAGPRPGCGTAQGAEFSWWPGVWNYATPGYDPAVSTVTASTDGCMLTEEFVDIHGQRQHTTIQYDTADRSWRRTVVDPFRTYRSRGVFAADGGISFYETPLDRETYRPTDADHVHFLGEKSDDGGRTWRVLFDATYTRKH